MTPDEIAKEANSVPGFQEVVSTGIGPDIPNLPQMPSTGTLPTTDNQKYGKAFQAAKALVKSLEVDTLDKFFSMVEEIYKQL